MHIWCWMVGNGVFCDFLIISNNIWYLVLNGGKIWEEIHTKLWKNSLNMYFALVNKVIYMNNYWRRKFNLIKTQKSRKSHTFCFQITRIFELQTCIRIDYNLNITCYNFRANKNNPDRLFTFVRYRFLSGRGTRNKENIHNTKSKKEQKYLMHLTLPFLV